MISPLTIIIMGVTTIALAGVILGMVSLGVVVIGKWDTPLTLDGRLSLGIAAAALLEAGAILLAVPEGQGCSRLLLAVIGGSLLLACVTDILICQVYQFGWWPALAAAAVLFWRRYCRQGFGEEGGILLWEMLKPLCIFFFLQFILFRRMYGKADYFAFCLCALAEAAGGMELTGHLSHMLLAYGLLFPVQALQHNINGRGNLKKPVPFLPYITAAFWITIIFRGNFAG